MPNVSLYIDEELYLPLAIEALRRRKDLYRFMKDVLRQACQDARETQAQQPGWILVDGLDRKPSLREHKLLGRRER